LTSRFPRDLPEKVDLRRSPSVAAEALEYLQLVRLSEELGTALEEGEVDSDWLRDWKHRVRGQINDDEAAMLMAAPEAAEFTLDEVPRQCWLNLRQILMSREA
jgi:hypothetical protein